MTPMIQMNNVQQTSNKRITKCFYVANRGIRFFRIRKSTFLPINYLKMPLTKIQLNPEYLKRRRVVINHNKKLNGWSEIAKHACYSVKRVQQFEKLGMKVERERRGKSYVVWAYAADVDDFVKKHINEVEKINSKSVESRHEILFQFPKINRHFLISFAFMIVFCFGVGRFYNLSISKEKDFHGYHWIENESGSLHQLVIHDQNGEIIRPIYSPSTPIYRRYAKQFLEFERFGHIAFRHKGRDRQAALLERFRGHFQIHDMNQSKKIDLLLDVDTKAGFPINDFYACGCYRLEMQSFKGWALLSCSQRNYSGCLVLLDEKLNEVGRIYHPGRISSIAYLEDKIFLAGSLNAREIDTIPGVGAKYRPFLSLMPIQDILCQEVQILPFSPSSIPTRHRRDYYTLVQYPILNPKSYIALEPSPLYSSKLFIEQNDFLIFTTSSDLANSIFLVFDKQLNFLDKYTVEHEFTGVWEEVYFNTRFQYWLGDRWSPWLGEYPPY